MALHVSCVRDSGACSLILSNWVNSCAGHTHPLCPCAASGKLSADEYPYVAAPPSPSSARASLPSSSDTTPKAGISVRSMRTTGTWAKKAGSGNTPDKFDGARVRAGKVSGLCDDALCGCVHTHLHMPRSNPHPHPQGGRRLFVFIVGGVTYSEMRCAHRLSTRLGRDVFLGGTSVETPPAFLRHVADLSRRDHTVLEIDGGGGGGGGGGGFFRFGS